MTDTTTLGLVVHDQRPRASKLAAELAGLAADRGMATVPHDAPDWDSRRVDLLIGIGGDGTLLAAAEIALEIDVPVVGVNLGRVGYLAEIEPAGLQAMLDGIESRSLEETSRMTLEARTSTAGPWVGVNDVVVEKLETRQLVQIAVEIGGDYFTTYRADGIITATPLGSTAYSLSAGGPVVDPALDAIIVTPVAPHSLLSRSIVLTAGTEISYSVELDRPVRVNVDGREAAVLDEGDTVTVSAGSRRVRFLSLGAHPFPQGVRRQFGLDHA